MNKQQAILFVFLLLLFNNHGKAQVNFRIILDNCTDSSILLTSYYGNKIKLVDTVYNNNNIFSFDNKDYPNGIYILASQNKNKLFEFVVNNESGFTLYADKDSLTNIIAEESIENQLFFKHLRLRRTIYQKAKQISDSASFKNDTGLPVNELEYELDSLQKILLREEESIINKYPDLFIAKLLKAGKEIQVPDSIVSDSLKSFIYFKKHFWDNLNLKDERFIRTPILDQKLNTYFNDVIFLNPDSTIAAIDHVISLARPSKEIVSYLLWYFIAKYQNPKYMGFDAVFVHLVDNYFLKEEVLNSSASINEKLEERSNKLKPLLIGELAPNLLLIDTSDRFVSFRDLKSDYILLLFWDFKCSVCEDEIEELNEILESTNYLIDIYAININGDINQWKNNIRSRNLNWHNVNGTQSITDSFYNLYDINGTPRLFLLNAEKKIIAKHFKVAQLIPIIENQFMKTNN